MLQDLRRGLIVDAPIDYSGLPPYCCPHGYNYQPDSRDDSMRCRQWLRSHLVDDVERSLSGSAKPTEPGRTYDVLDPTLARLSTEA
jgi:hypothetical protein